MKLNGSIDETYDFSYYIFYKMTEVMPLKVAQFQA